MTLVSFATMRERMRWGIAIVTSRATMATTTKISMRVNPALSRKGGVKLAARRCGVLIIKNGGGGIRTPDLGIMIPLL